MVSIISRFRNIRIVKNPDRRLDFGYLENWATRLGLSEELQYVLNAARS